VTGVALIAFLALALAASPLVCAQLIIWIFVMRILMILTSLSRTLSTTRGPVGVHRESSLQPEMPLTKLVWITSIISILVTFAASYVLLPFAIRGLAKTVEQIAGLLREPVGRARPDYQLRDDCGRVDSGVHEDIHQHALAARQGSRHVGRARAAHR